jgi:UPF0755 protein
MIKFLAKLLIGFILFCAVVIGYLYYRPIKRGEAFEELDNLKIPQGLTLTEVARLLKGKGVIKEEPGFVFFGQILGKSRRVKAGKYDFSKTRSIADVYTLLGKGGNATMLVTIPEGLTIREIASILKKEVELDSAEFVSLAYSDTLAPRLGVEIERSRGAIPGLEGYLFPDTYDLCWEQKPRPVIEMMLSRFNQAFVDSLRERCRDLGFTPHQILTLASMIEKETGLAKERPLISAVYHNRLKRGMLLQCDPTVIYVLPDLGRPLYSKDLQVDSRYNTYRYRGLPPGPIANPGIASIAAALYPAEVGYLYFVARGDGSHVFSNTLQEHNNARIRVKRARRQS